MNGRLDAQGMSDHQIDTLMKWQARADLLERQVGELQVMLEEAHAARAAAEGNAEKWKRAALLRDAGASAVSGQLRDLIDKMKKEKAVIVNALRCLLEVLPDNATAVNHLPTARRFAKALREARELLSVVDDLKGGR